MAVKKTDLPVESVETVDGIADPAPATRLEEASGAIIEPAIVEAVDVTHESVDANPRAGTTATQNAIHWNAAKPATPEHDEVAGQGIVRAVYGTS